MTMSPTTKVIPKGNYYIATKTMRLGVQNGLNQQIWGQVFGHGIFRQKKYSILVKETLS